MYIQDHVENKMLIEVKILVVLYQGQLYQVITSESIGASISNNVTLFVSKFEVAVSSNKCAACLYYNRCSNTS